MWKKLIFIFLVAAALVAVGFFGKSKYEQSKMQPVETHEIIPGVYTVKNDFVNFFIIKTGEFYVAIDTGSDSSKTETELQRLGISSGDVAAVFLTHSHYDHTGSLKLFKNAAVYTGGDGLSDKFNLAYKILDDDETVDVSGVEIKCIYTPGHTSGSVSYLIDGKYLFVGDTLSLNNDKVGLFNSFYNKDDKVQKSSIDKLAGIRTVEYIFSSHYGFTNNAIFLDN